jgi:hypothetical protein
MAICEHCGNDYDKSFQVVMNGRTHNFDSFECAIHALAPPNLLQNTELNEQAGPGLRKKRQQNGR